MLNAFNHAQYTVIATNLNGIGFGQPVAAAPARVIQLQRGLGF